MLPVCLRREADKGHTIQYLAYANADRVRKCASLTEPIVCELFIGVFAN